MKKNECMSISSHNIYAMAARPYQNAASTHKWFISFCNLIGPSKHFSIYGYIILFIVLYRLYQNSNIRDRKGVLSGYFLIGLCFIRFMVEFVKESQGGIETFLPGLSTGQWLSIPFIILGFILLSYRNKSIRTMN